MPDLINSQRRLAKATYTPLTIPPQDQRRSGRVIEKLAFLRSLNIRPEEFSALRRDSNLRELRVSAGSARATRLLSMINRATADRSPSALQKHGPLLARSSFDDLVSIGRALAKLRLGAARAVRGTREGTGTGGERANPSTRTAATASNLAAEAQRTTALVEQFQSYAPIASVGQIHLERLEMTPVGVEHGELIHSVPLAQKETVNVTHREWTVTTQTFETLTQDSLEGFSETAVTEKSDLAQASDVESRHSSSLDVNGSVSATYNGGAYSITASAAVGYQSQDATQESEKRSVAHSMAITRSASTRTKKEHKTSFRVSSVSGAENLAVQVITNPSDNQAMRVDYYQLLRKWRVDLIRYGLRMTYDIAIPNPGYGLIGEVIELRQLNESVVRGNTFSLDPTAINQNNWQQFEQNFGASVDPPPSPSIDLMQTSSVPQQTYDKWGAGTIQFDVPDGYSIASAHFRGFFSLYTYDPNGRHLQVDVFGEPNGTTNTPLGEYQGSDALLDFDLTNATIVNRTGTVFLTYTYHNVDFGNVQVTVTATPTPEKMQAWQSAVWSQLREADQANYEAKLALARDRKAQLQAEIDELDALTLRKMEREEVMRWVIQWLLGPNFALTPDAVRAAIASNVDDAGQQPGTYAFPSVYNLPASDWQTIVEHGEFIKYLHNAIEWESVIFFAYPYFWDRYENWEFKEFLLHPDHIHRDFLRSGCARVVLPIRTGFEVSFAMLMETGSATAPPDTSYPYVSIGEEIRDYAMTNYEGIPPANPDHNVRTLLYPQQRAAWQDIQAIMKALAQFYLDNGSYPKDLLDNGLAVAAQKAGVTLPGNDPWGNPYDYRLPGIYGDYDLWSHGATPPTVVDGLDAEITSWAEGSIIGRWYEYTPTSALDVAVTMIPLGQAPLQTQPEPA